MRDAYYPFYFVKLEIITSVIWQKRRIIYKITSFINLKPSEMRRIAHFAG